MKEQEEVMPHGKYKGMQLSEIPLFYLKCMALAIKDESNSKLRELFTKAKVVYHNRMRG